MKAIITINKKVTHANMPLKKLKKLEALGAFVLYQPEQNQLQKFMQKIGGNK